MSDLLQSQPGLFGDFIRKCPLKRGGTNANQTECFQNTTTINSGHLEASLLKFRLDAAEVACIVEISVPQFLSNWVPLQNTRLPPVLWHSFRHPASRGGLTASAPLDCNNTGAEANEPPGQARWRVLKNVAHRCLRQTILQGNAVPPAALTHSFAGSLVSGIRRS
jgi:hypothetical protein